jgi:TonB family protein
MVVKFFAVTIFTLIAVLVSGCATTAPAPATRPNASTMGARTPVPFVDDTPYKGSAIDVSKVDAVPVPIFRVAPQYPAQFRRHRINGDAVVEFVVDIDGSTTELTARRATDLAFAKSAIQAISKWTFQPAQKDGRAVRCRLQVPIVFQIN